ncbi:hypothetical protein ACQQ2Q_18840 [Agrobacterium sp. ES01]|uniref:hypothetical protein n=1 Tax=Agrobacterium sp. ES01 TaxID=3420714 RepID=UPI003D0E6C9A
MTADAILFQRTDNIEASWAVVNEILTDWEKGEPQPHKSGSQGPKDADTLLARGRLWLPLTELPPEIRTLT